MTKKKPRFGALLVLEMPRSHESSKPPGRRSTVRHVKPIEPANTSCYGTFVQFCHRAKSLKTLSEWSYKVLADRFVSKKVVEPYLLSELEIVVDDSLGFTVKVCGSYLIEVHPLYLKYRRSVQTVTLSTLVKNLGEYTMCYSVTTTKVTSKVYHNVIPINHDLMQDNDEQQFPHTAY